MRWGPISRISETICPFVRSNHQNHAHNVDTHRAHATSILSTVFFNTIAPQ